MTPYFSKVISVSRFPIIVGVVFIHALIISNGTDIDIFKIIRNLSISNNNEASISIRT